MTQAILSETQRYRKVEIHCMISKHYAVFL